MPHTSHVKIEQTSVGTQLIGAPPIDRPVPVCRSIGGGRDQSAPTDHS
ncbi:MAG: hypothetical protein ABI396_00160 [Ktedonobacteraceae bacterium]